MPLFTYAATDASGLRMQGILEAANLAGAEAALQQRGLMVTEIHTATEAERRAASPPATIPEPLLQNDEDDSAYLPLLDTLRLYAGWLMAWYCVVYAVGYFRLTQRLSVDIPFVDELFQSTLVLQLALGTFLFLLLTSILKWLRGGVFLGILLTLIGIGVFAVYRANM